MKSSIINIKRFINKENVICFDGEEEINITRSQQNKLNLLIRGIEYRRDKAHTLKLKKCVDYSALNILGFKDKIWPYKCKYTEFVDDKPKDCPGRIYVYENECEEIIGYMVINADHMDNCKPEICAEKLKRRNFNIKTLMLAAKTGFEYNPEINTLIKEEINADDFKNVQKRVKKLIKRNSSRRMSQANKLFEDDYDMNDNKVQLIINEPTQGNGSNGTTAVDYLENTMDVTENSQSIPQIENKIIFEMIDDDSTHIKIKMMSDAPQTFVKKPAVVQQTNNNDTKTFQKNIPSQPNTDSNKLSYDEFFKILEDININELESWLRNDEITSRDNLLMDIDNDEFDKLVSCSPDELVSRINLLLDESELTFDDQIVNGSQVFSASLKQSPTDEMCHVCSELQMSID